MSGTSGEGRPARAAALARAVHRALAWLRRLGDPRGGLDTGIDAVTEQPLMECPRCGRCEDGTVPTCPADGSLMRPDASVPRIVGGRYRIDRLIGRGGMGAVYRAVDLRMDRTVALKTVRADLLNDSEARGRFRQEARVVARLQHPSIVAVLDHGAFPDGGGYLVMELIDGQDLRCVLQREGRLDVERAARILSAVCAAVEAAHREGVLHLDLKPENILLPGDDDEVKVLDFGLAKVAWDGAGFNAADDPRGGLTVDGVIVGTPAYMAPEQLHGGPLDGRTDVFSLGVIAYEMISGELPFGRGSLAETVLAQSRGVPSLHGGQVMASVEGAIRQALETDPDRRPASPQTFAYLVSAAVAL